MKHVTARLVPKDLNFLQKRNRMRVAEDMLERVNNDPTFMKRIVTGDETWVYEFDMQTSQQASEWRLPTESKPKKPRQSRSKVKVMFTVFFDYRGVVHSEFLPKVQTVDERAQRDRSALAGCGRISRPDLLINSERIPALGAT
ncbi:unnamed protein product [Arctia plantaginis]|uniref:Mariner Mos1 transposase n=1 Tax=Arctia plantaginis TaxID=874455 RepID=A0A8S1AXW2_ARCPL|nr:unnamed protein product [Arctia plantaginis]